MAEQTPTWGLTYAEYGDPACIAGAVQQLAEDIDNAVTGIEAQQAQDRNQPSAKISTVTAQVLTTGVETTVTYPVGSEVYDNTAMVDLTVSTSRITATGSTLGIFLVSGRVDFEQNTFGNLRRLTLNHSVYGIIGRFTEEVDTTTDSKVITFSQIMPFDSAGDFITLSAFQNSGANVSITNRQFQCTRLTRF